MRHSIERRAADFLRQNDDLIPESLVDSWDEFRGMEEQVAAQDDYDRPDLSMGDYLDDCAISFVRSDYGADYLAWFRDYERDGSYDEALHGEIERKGM